MQGGKLDQVIRLEAEVTTQGTAGGMQKAWTLWAEALASVRHFNGAERRATGVGGEVAVARTEFTIWYRPGVTAKMRVVFNGEIYNIVHVNNFMGKNESLVLTCDTGANDG